MFVVLYRWRVKDGFEKQFTESWAKITDYFVQNFDSLGSRLHIGDDGIYYAYAQWKSSEQRDKAFLETELSETRELMIESIGERLTEIKLDILSDHLK